MELTRRTLLAWSRIVQLVERLLRGGPAPLGPELGGLVFYLGDVFHRSALGRPFRLVRSPLDRENTRILIGLPSRPDRRNPKDLRRGAVHRSGEARLESPPGLGESLADHPLVGEDRHEIVVPGPARDDVQVS